MNTLLAADLSDAFLPTKALNDNSDLFFGREFTPGFTFYVPDQGRSAVRLPVHSR